MVYCEEMAGYSDLLTDIHQGYTVVDILPEEDSCLFGKVAQDIKQGYTVIDILEENDTFVPRVGCSY